MIGSQKKQEGLFCYGVSLEKRVPQNHPLRKIKQALDLGFVRPEVSQFYGYNGNESVAPEVIVKLMFLLFAGSEPDFVSFCNICHSLQSRVMGRRVSANIASENLSANGVNVSGPVAQTIFPRP